MVIKAPNQLGMLLLLPSYFPWYAQEALYRIGNGAADHLQLVKCFQRTQYLLLIWIRDKDIYGELYG